MHPLPSAHFNRSEIVEQIFSRYRGQRVLVIGVGGGGDVVSTLPTCFDLERVGAQPIPGGLTWKRIVHDPYGRPRPIELFQNVERINNLIGQANPSTRTVEGIAHIEANVSKVLGGAPVAMIDISAGTTKLREALEDYKRVKSIDAIIGVDAGGDVLCFGNEPTLESPLCDQVVLGALSHFPDSLLGVFGFGADGEMTLTDLRTRFAGLIEQGAYRGMIPISVDDIPKMRSVLQEAPTEASRLPMQVAETISAERLCQIGSIMNLSKPEIDLALGMQHEVPMRNGSRTARLSDISAATMFFNPSAVFESSRFSTLMNPDYSIDQNHLLLTEAGITTEFSEKERSMLTTQRAKH